MRLVNATTGAVCDDADIDEHLFKWLAAEEGDQFAQWKTMQPHLAIWGEVKGTTVLDYSIAMRWACALATLHPLRYISANLQEHLIMQDNATQRASQRLSVEPTICSIKIRLVVSFYLRTADGAAALVKLFRPFISWAWPTKRATTRLAPEARRILTRRGYPGLWTSTACSASWKRRGGQC